MQISKHDFEVILGDVYVNCLETKDMNKKQSKLIKMVREVTEFVLYYCGIEIEADRT
jgi:hypothetical protein